MEWASLSLNWWWHVVTYFLLSIFATIVKCPPSKIIKENIYLFSLYFLFICGCNSFLGNALILANEKKMKNRSSLRNIYVPTTNVFFFFGFVDNNRFVNKWTWSLNIKQWTLYMDRIICLTWTRTWWIAIALFILICAIIIPYSAYFLPHKLSFRFTIGSNELNSKF